MRHAVAILLLAPALAAAGQTCTERATTGAELEQAFELSTAVLGRLPADGPAAVVLARVGDDVSRYGLRWTHAGLAYRSGAVEPWRVLHKLNRCGAATSDLYREGLANFFLDEPYELRAWLLVPQPALQARLLEALAGDAPWALHEPRYNVIAYPYALAHQNSNQWLLELIAAAASDAASRQQAQRVLRAGGYRPGRIRISAAQRLGASLFRANVAFTDHPLAERLSGRYSTVTVESIEAFLRRRGWLQSADEIRLGAS